MKFGLGSASGIAGAMQGFGNVENQKMQYQQDLNKLRAQMKVDKDANTPTAPNPPVVTTASNNSGTTGDQAGSGGTSGQTQTTGGTSTYTPDYSPDLLRQWSSVPLGTNNLLGGYHPSLDPFGQYRRHLMEGRSPIQLDVSPPIKYIPPNPNAHPLAGQANMALQMGQPVQTQEGWMTLVGGRMHLNNEPY